MDIPATQVYEDDFNPTQNLCDSLQFNANKEQVQIGVLNIGANTYPIKRGINKIGRHPECNIVLNNQTVSKNHAEIEADNGDSSTWLCDLHSSNKTKLNNTILRPGRCYELKSGSIIEFGMVRAVYKIYEPLDESLIPETPAPRRQKQQKTIIPGTPDTSLNNSSTSGNSSIIPATQTAEDEGFLFRRPSLPQRNSSSSRKSFIQDSFMEDDSMNESRRSSCGKENVGEPTVSIHDMETQRSFNLQNETDVDIHDVETQKFSLNSVRAARQNALSNQRVHIHDLETQHDEDIEIADRASDLYDVETQRDEDVEVKARVSDLHDVETQHDEDVEVPTRVSNVHDLETQHHEDVEVGTRVSNVHNLETQHDEDAEVRTRVSNVHDLETQHHEDVEVGTRVSNVHDLETQQDEDVEVPTRVSNVHNLETQHDEDVEVGTRVSNVHNLETQHDEAVEVRTRVSNVHNLETRHDEDVEVKARVSDSHDVDTQRGEDVEVRIRISNVHDLETQHDEDMEVGTRVNNVYDVETQHIEYEEVKTVVGNVHDLETQHVEDVEMRTRVSEIHDVETQQIEDMEVSVCVSNIHDVETHDIKMPRKIDVPNLSSRESDAIQDNEYKSEETDLARKNVDSNEEASNKVARSVSDKNDPEEAENAEKSSQECLQLSFATNLADVSSELDQSTNLNGSQDLLGTYVPDSPSNETKSKSTPNDSRQSNETIEKSTDEENIFDAATQAKDESDNVCDAIDERSNVPLRSPSVNDDSDDTDQEAVFQRYSRVSSQDSAQPSKSQTTDSDDSNTDEEGQFSAITLKRKQASGDSDDIFNATTQRGDLNSKESVTKEVEVCKSAVDFDIPIQEIDMEEDKINVRAEGSGDNKDSDDSDTDEEGQFREVALQEKRVSSSLENQQNDSREVKNDDREETDSDNLRDAPTNRCELENKQSLTEEAEVSESHVDFDMATQLSDTEELEINVRTEENADNKDIDDSDTDEEGQFTEIGLKQKRASSSFEIPQNESTEVKKGNGENKDSSNRFDVSTKRGDPKYKEAEEASADFDTPTQIIDTEGIEINIRAQENVDIKDDDSSTDDEGQFTEIALKRKRASSSFEIPQNESTEVKKGNRKNSGNLFDVPTKRGDLKLKEAEGSKVSADFDTPTQIIDTEEIEVNIRAQGSVHTKDDDSSTDDEGQFTEIALKQKRASPSFEIPQNESTEVEDSSAENRDSDNLFDAPTQRGDPENKESLTKEAEVSESAVDFDTPTQIIDTEGIEVNIRTEENVDTKDDDSDTDDEGQFTEIALKQKRASPSFEIPQNESTTVAAKNGDIKNRDSDSIFDVPTQRIDLTDKKSLVKETESSKSPVDFDMPTQLIDTEELEINIGAEGNADNKDADDADTDEEGQFSEIALQQKRASSSFENPQNENTGAKNGNEEDRDSDDLFDVPMQRGDLENKESLTKEAEVNESAIDFDTPTQIIDTEELKINVRTEENANMKDDDSDTDKEDQFAEIALKQKRASPSFEIPQNESTEARNSDGGSRNSDNLFDAPTQRVNQKNEKSSAKAVEVSAIAVDFDMPTQIINTEELEANFRAEENAEMDLAATQIIPIDSESLRKVNEPTANLTTRDKIVDEMEDITEMEDNTDTQILSVPEKNPDSDDNGSEKVSLLEERSVEDIDYEMAPTQLVVEVIEKPVLADERGKKESKKVNLDDTLERNLNAMFDDVNDESLEEQSQLSTQTLTNMLQSSECDDKTADNSNEDSQSPDIGRIRRKGRRKNKAGVASVSSEAADNKYRESTLETRRRNIIANSPEPGCSKENTFDDKTEEEIRVTSETIDTVNTVSDVSLRLTPTTSSTSRQSRKHRLGELQVSEATPTKTELPKIDEEVPEEPEEIPQQKSITPVQLSTMLQNDEEDDFMACFPAVRISGTLSNPGSPASSKSSESGPKTKSGRPKRGSKKAVSKKKESPRKSSKKAARDTESSNTIVKPDSSVMVKNSSDVDKPLSAPQSDEEEVNKTSKRVTKKTLSGNSQKPTTSKHTAQQNSVSSVNLEDRTSRSSSVQSRGMTGNSSEENIDRSSVFQVENEAPIVNTEPAKRATLNVSSARKRSFSASRQENEGNDAKKRKQDAPLITRDKTKPANKVNRCSSANILDYITRSSPVNFEAQNRKLSLSQPTNLCSKELMIKVTRMSSCSPTVLPPSSTPLESKTESIVLPGIRKARRASVSSHSSVSSVASRENENVAVSKTRRNASKRSSRRKKETEDVNSQGGEESQEVEMFMCADSQGSSSSVGSGENEKVSVTETGRNTSQRASRRKKETEDSSSHKKKESHEVETCADGQGSSSAGNRVNEKPAENEIRRNMNQRASRRKKETEDTSSEMGEESQEVEMFMCADSQSSSSSIGSRENEKAPVNETRGSTSQRISRRKRKAEDITDQVEEESQEVEMIMEEEILKVKTTVSQTASNKDARSTRTRNTATTSGSSAKNTQARSTATANSNAENTKTKNTRKRANANYCTDTESTASSDICESDDTHFEMPASKAKQAVASKNTCNAVDSRANESTSTRTKRTIKQPSRYIDNTQQSIMDSSSEESKEITVAQTSVNTASSASTKQRGRKRKAEKELDKTESRDFVIEDSSSGMNSSIDNASVISTPKMRRIESSFSVSTPLKVKHKILFTGIASNDYSKLLTKLGASPVEDPTKCTVLVTDKVRRTFKFLCALAQAVPIVSVDWLIDSKKAGRFVELENYILKDPAAEAKFGFKLGESLEIAKGQKLLEGYTVVLTANVAPPPLPELKAIISSCGGKPLVRPSPSWPQKAVIISCETDLAAAKKFLAKAPKTVTIQSTEFLLTGILRQELNFVEHKLT